MRAIFNKSTWLKRSLLITILFPVALLWGEMFTRILLPQNVDSRMNIYRSDPIAGYTYEPYAKTYEKGREYKAFYKINSLGLRDREYGSKEQGLFRVLLLGDSFAVSHGLAIEDSLSRRLEEALQTIAAVDKLPARIEVINAAVGGYSPYNYWKAYHRWAKELKPDIVVVAVSPDDYDCSNEHMNYLIDGGETLALGKNRQELHATGLRNIKMMRKWLSWNSELYVLLRNFLYYNELSGSISLWMDARAATYSGQLEPYIVPQSEYMQRAWSKTFSYLQSLHRDTTADGAAMIVIPLPMKLEIIPEEYRRVLKSSGSKPEHIDIDQPVRGIITFCQEENIPVLDPRPSMRKRHAEVPCYFVYDGHWNAEGIRTATTQITNQWRYLGLPPWRNTSRDR